MADSGAYAIYVEKELIGKRIKSSKVKVGWQLAFASDCIVHQVELKHSIVTGKREISLDGSLLFQSQQMFQGKFEHSFTIMGHVVRITVEDAFEGFLYDLLIDGIPFHRCPRKSISEIEAMRKAKAEVKVTDFKSFIGKSSAKALDGEKPGEDEDNEDESEKKKEKKKKKKKDKSESNGDKAPEVDLLGDVLESTTISAPAAATSAPPAAVDFWGAPVVVPKQPQAFAATSDPFASNPFGSTPVAPPQAAAAAPFDPFNPFGSSQYPAATTTQPAKTIDLASAYAKQPPTTFASTQTKQNDPFSTDLYNLSNLNAPTGNQSQQQPSTSTYRSNVPLNQLPAGQTQPSLNPFGAAPTLNTSSPMMAGGYQQQQQPSPAVYAPPPYQQPYQQQQQQPYSPFGAPMTQAPPPQQQQPSAFNPFG